MTNNESSKTHCGGQQLQDADKLNQELLADPYDQRAQGTYWSQRRPENLVTFSCKSCM